MLNRSEFVYPVQTKKMQENNEDPRIQVSEMLNSIETYKSKIVKTV